MGILCKIIRNEDNTIQSIEAPNGNESILFKDLKQLDLSDQEALDAWTVSNTQSFKDEVLVPRMNKHKTSILNKLRNLTPKRNKLTIVVDGKGTEVDITQLKYETARNNNGITVFATAELNGKTERLGRIRLKEFRDGFQIDSSLLKDLQIYEGGELQSIKGNGLGTQLYKQVVGTLVRRGTPLYSDISASPEADGIWRKFTELGIVQTEIVPKGRIHKIDPMPSSLDENGEPSAKDVLAYIANTNNKNVEPLTEEQIADVSEALLNTSLNSSEDLIQQWDRMFFENGGFEVTRDGLNRTDLYTQAEQENILNSPEIQESIRETYFTLKASPIVFNDMYVNKDFLTVADTETNIIGKFRTSNPFVLEKDALEQLAGATTREEFESKLLESDLEYLKEAYYRNLGSTNPFTTDLFFIMSDYSNVPVKEVRGGELVDKVDNSVEELFSETLTDPSNTELVENIVYLQDISPTVWVNNPDDIKVLLKEFSSKTIDIGLDTVGIEDYYDVRPIEEFNQLFNTIDIFMNNQNEQTFNSMVAVYKDFFSINEQPAIETVKDAEGKAVYVNSSKSAFELFSKYGLLPTGENLYRRVNNERPLEDVYESLYLNVVDNPVILPVEAFQDIAIGRDGVLNRSVINDITRKEEVIETMQNFVRTQISKIDSFGVARDTDMLEKMYIYSSFFNTELNNVQNNPSSEQEVSVMENYPSNVDYLTGEFIADFNKEYLREKLKDSQAFSDFYSNFEVTRDGIKMIDTDPITMRKMEIELEGRKDLRNHLLLQKESQIRPEPVDENFVLEDDTIMRNYYANFPTELAKFTDDYSLIGDDTIMAKTSDNLIRVDQGVYEMVDSYGDESVFKRIQVNNSVYKAYSKEFSKPVNKLDLSAYGITTANESLERTINNTYSKEQETNIDNEIDNCS